MKYKTGEERALLERLETLFNFGKIFQTIRGCERRQLFRAFRLFGIKLGSANIAWMSVS